MLLRIFKKERSVCWMKAGKVNIKKNFFFHRAARLVLHKTNIFCFLIFIFLVKKRLKLYTYTEVSILTKIQSSVLSSDVSTD